VCVCVCVCVCVVKVWRADRRLWGRGGVLGYGRWVGG